MLWTRVAWSVASSSPVWCTRARHLAPISSVAARGARHAFSTSPVLSMGKEKFYAIQKGARGAPRVVTSWRECRSFVRGVRGAVYKSFSTHAEAAAFAAGKNGYRASTANKSTTTITSRSSSSSISSSSSSRLANHSTPGRRLSSGSSGSDVDESVILTSGVVERNSPVRPSTPPSPPSITVVYADGACTGNGRGNARAGVGVWFGESDVRNVSEPLAGSPQTNQRAELTAAIRALEKLEPHESARIMSDSMYVVKGVTEWLQGWQRNGWKNARGDAVANRDLWDRMVALLRERGSGEGTLEWEHVRGHSGDYGNDKADELATAAAAK